MEVPQNSEQLLRMLSSEDQREIGVRMLMQEYGHRLYLYIRRIVVDHDDAEDALQETCIQVYRKIDQLQDKDQLVPWIYKIATRESLNILRHHTGLFRSIDDMGGVLERKLTAECSLDADAAELLLQQALLKLPTQQRLIFCMRYYDDLSYEEIALITGKRIGTLKTNYSYAVNKVKSYLKAHEL